MRILRPLDALVAAMAMLVLAPGVRAEGGGDPQGQLIAVAAEAKQLRAANPGGTKGKAAGLIEKAKGIDLGEKASVMHQVMKVSLLAELQAMNGDYEVSNGSYRQAYALMPNVGFYRSMVANMRLKGDQAGAMAVIEEYRAIVEKEFPGNEQATRRQDLLQFVETALQDGVPEATPGKASPGAGK